MHHSLFEAAKKATGQEMRKTSCAIKHITAMSPIEHCNDHTPNSTIDASIFKEKFC